MAKSPVTVTVTGAAGNIGYALLFRIASGSMLGADQPVNLRLLEIPMAVDKAEGTAMELFDSAFPVVESIEVFDDPKQAFAGANIGMLVGSRPRTKGMERADLLAANGEIFKVQGQAIAAGAADDFRAIVVGNPANTNCAILAANAGDFPAERFTAMMRLDHNRALAQLAQKAGCLTKDIDKVTVWGNHGPSMYADITRATVRGAGIADILADRAWVEDDFLPTVAQRGTAVINKRGASSAASAAAAAVDHIHDWFLGQTGSFTTMGVMSHGEYGLPEGIVCGMPVTCKDGEYQIVEGLEIDEFSRSKMNFSADDLAGELAAVKELGFC